MKRFIIECTSFLVLLLAIFCFAMIVLPRNTDNSIYLDKQKLEMVKTTPTPRIIFVGGSNLYFGLHSQAVKDSLRKNVVNAGLQAGLGLKLKIDEINPYLRQGDWVVISPEYTHFYGDGAYGGPSVLPILAEFTPEIIKSFNRQQVEVVIKGLPNLFMARVRYFLSMFKSKSGKYEEKASGCGKYGDEVRHLTMPSPVKHIKTPPIKGKFNEEFYAYFIQRMKSWQQRGITVIMLPPAYYDKGFRENKPKIDCLAMRLAESGFPFADKPEVYSYPRNLIYNTLYHLNKEGREIRTQSVIKALRNLE